MGKTRLPPGLRFHPTDVELVKYYLKRKVLGKKLHFQGILELDIYKHAPWDLPDKSGWRSGDLKWYFFCPREKKYATGKRMNRSTGRGFWKTTGKDRDVNYNQEVVGMIKTLVFHTGKPPKGVRTDWVMYEYRLEEKKLAEKGVVQDAYVLCAIFKKDGPGPRNGAQYGAPFREEDWDEEEEEEGEEEVNGGQAVLSADMFAPAFVMPVSQNCSVPSGSIYSEVYGETSRVSCPVAPNLRPMVSDNAAATLEPGQPMHNDEIDAMLSMFSEEVVPLPFESDKNGMVDCPNNGRHLQPNPFSDGPDIYENLPDLGSLAGLGEPGENVVNFCGVLFHKEQMLQPDDTQFMELVDLDVPLDVSNEPQGYGRVQAGDLYADINFCNNSGNSHAQAGGLHAVNNFCNTSGNLFCPDNSCIASGLVTPYSLASQLPGASYALDHQPYVSSQGDGAAAAATISDRGYDILESGSCPGNTPVIHGAQPEQSERRGQKRISCSKLQYLWESVHSFVVKEHRALSLDDGSSSIHVKAEVTISIWSDGCTKDALSDKLGEFPLVQLNICATTFFDKGEVTLSGSTQTYIYYYYLLLLLPM